jgi:anti-sigma-K factor RskA
MLRRSSLSCRQFRHQHVEYVDGSLRGAARVACDAHVDECQACSQLDIRVRRGLLALQTLPVITPSPGFHRHLRARLAAERLRLAPAHDENFRRDARWWLAGTVLAASAVLLLLGSGQPRHPTAIRLAPAVVHAPERPPAALNLVAAHAQAQEAPPRGARVPRFEALPNSMLPPDAGAPSRAAGVRLQVVTYIGQ